MRVFAPLSLSLLLLSTSPLFAEPRAEDDIALQLTAEGFVETATANVTVQFDTAQDAVALADARARLKQILQTLVPHSDWRFTRMDRSLDPAGLERWRVTAEARLAEKDLAGLADKAKQASKPGVQVKIAAIDFTPTQAEREAVAAQLRSKLYTLAQEEAKRLQQAFPGRPYRVKAMSFQTLDSAPVPTPRPMAMAARSGISPEMAVGADATDTAPTVARRMEVQGQVILSAPSP